MPTMIEQLQIDASGDSVLLVVLLRRMKVIAVKLKLDNVEQWVEDELQGYKGPVPPYRYVEGTPMALNPVRGWIPLLGRVGNISRLPVKQPISSLEDSYAGADGHLQMAYASKLVEAIDEYNGTNWGHYALFISRSNLAEILQHVRGMVLDWALGLEKAGVIGSEFSFTKEEQERAMAINITNHGAMFGAFGSGNTVGDIRVDKLDINAAADVLKQTRDLLPTLVEAGLDEEALKAVLDRADAALATGDSGVSTLWTALAELRAIATNALGSLVATGVVAALNKILGTGVPTP